MGGDFCSREHKTRLTHTLPSHHSPSLPSPSPLPSPPAQDVQNALFRPFVYVYVVHPSPYDPDPGDRGQPPSLSQADAFMWSLLL